MLQKVSKKSIPSSWVYLFAISLALCLSMVSSTLYLILKTHLYPVGFFPLGRSMKHQVSFSSTALISLLMALVYSDVLLAST